LPTILPDGDISKANVPASSAVGVDILPEPTLLMTLMLMVLTIKGLRLPEPVFIAVW
jgi:hypothetical protein